MKGTCPGNCSYPGSLPSGVWSNPAVGALGGKFVSRNASEPDTAPLRSGSGQPANDGEASIGHEATSGCSDQAPRGVIRDGLSTERTALSCSDWLATCNVVVSVPSGLRTGSRSLPTCNHWVCSFWNRPWENPGLTRARVPETPTTRACLVLTILGKAGCGKPACPV